MPNEPQQPAPEQTLPEQETQNDFTQPTETHVSPPAKETGSTKLITWAVVVLVLVVLFAGGAYAYVNNFIPGVSSSFGANNSVAAVVNGEEITQGAVENARAQQEQAGGAIATDAQILDALIANVLVLQAAQAQNLTATEEEIDQQIAQIEAQFGDAVAFQAALSEEGITLSDFRDGIREQLSVQKYLNATIDVTAITATEEEIQTAYDQIAAAQEDIASLEEVSAQLEALILQQKQQQRIAQLVAQLRSQADVQIVQ